MTDRDAADVLVGRVVKPHGIRGEVVVDPLSDVPGRFDPGTTVRVDGRPSTIVKSRPHQGRLLVAFADVDDRTTAEELRGARITAAPLEVQPDTYLGDELLHLPVRRDDGTPLGHVAALIELPPAAGYDLVEVAHDEGTWLLPATDDYVEVDVDADGTPTALVVVDPPAGLLPDEQPG